MELSDKIEAENVSKGNDGLDNDSERLPSRVIKALNSFLLMSTLDCGCRDFYEYDGVPNLGRRSDVVYDGVPYLDITYK